MVCWACASAPSGGEVSAVRPATGAVTVVNSRSSSAVVISAWAERTAARAWSRAARASSICFSVATLVRTSCSTRAKFSFACTWVDCACASCALARSSAAW
jgi:hypothetical protein